MEGEEGGAVFRFGKEGEGRGGTPHKKFGSIPPPAVGDNYALEFGMGDGFGPGETDQVLLWGAERGRMRVGTPQKIGIPACWI